MRRDGLSQRRRPARQSLPELPPLQRPERKPLLEMDTPELVAWLSAQQAELEDFCSYVQDWRLSRNRRGLHTDVDDRYDQFLPRGLDLAIGLAEWRRALEAEQDE